MNLVFVVESLIKSLQFGAVNQVVNFFERSKDHSVILKISKIKRRCKTQRPLKGASLIEIMLAISILAIVVLGTAFFSFHTSGQVGLCKQRRAALQLAGQKMEQLKADNEVGKSEKKRGSCPDRSRYCDGDIIDRAFSCRCGLGDESYPLE